MVTGLKQQAVKSIKVEFVEEPVTAWGGLALAERVALRLAGFVEQAGRGDAGA